MSWINLSALWKIVVYGLIAGAGLPALFAIGLRTLSWPGAGRRLQTAGADSDTDQIVGGNMVGMIIAVIIFLVILAALGWCVWEVYQIGHPVTKK
jgi:ABC-type antimicrobial peptide transport system permease subunit